MAIESRQSEAYFSIRRDTRLCPSVTCGGFWVSQLNASRTQCADAVKHSECYVAQLTSENGAVQANRIGTAIVKGRILPKTFDEIGSLGQINVTELWLRQFSP
jgi:hypothetical protein